MADLLLVLNRVYLANFSNSYGSGFMVPDRIIGICNNLLGCGDSFFETDFCGVPFLICALNCGICCMPLGIMWALCTAPLFVCYGSEEF